MKKKLGNLCLRNLRVWKSLSKKSTSLENFVLEIYESGKLCPRNLPVWNSLSKKSTSHFSESLWLQIFYLKIIINPTFYKILLNFSRTPLSCTEVGGGLKVHIFKQLQRIERLILKIYSSNPRY